MGQALSLSSEQTRFISNGEVAHREADRQDQDRTSNNSGVAREIHVGLRSRNQQTALEPTLVPLTTRVHPDTAEALRNAHLQQQIARRKPDTKQDIVEAALRLWLAEHGYQNRS